MKKGVIGISIICLLAVSLVLASCSTSTITSIPSSTSRSLSTSTSTQTTSRAITTSTTSTTSVATGNWWDSLGVPQYGGDLVFRLSTDVVSFDPYNSQTLMSIESAWMEKLWSDDWTVNPAVFNYDTTFRPNEFVKGLLAQSWEFSDPSTFVVHLRQGVHWQDIPPANGREFVADDVVFDYDRLFGLGDGFTKPDPYWVSTVAWQSLSSVTAIDKYTVSFAWKVPNPEFILETLHGCNQANDIENPDAVKQWGNLNDWHHAIGTGAFNLQDYVSASSATLGKNPNYWGYDERYPKNNLPYADRLTYLIIPDDATALAGLRTGKIDFIEQIPFQQAQSIHKTNPDLLQTTIAITTALTVDPENDVKPFNDIRVREAMQMAIDLPTIANTYYGGTCPPYPSSLTSMYLTGWGWPYSEWPQQLKDEYAYNPTAAKQLLSAAGYPNGFNTDVVASTDSDLSLLQIVKSYFASIGINMDIRTIDPASWTTYVQIGHKHDQLAYRAAGLVGTTSEPLRQLNRLQTGYSVNWTMVSDPVFDAFYPKAMADTNIDDIKQVLVDANKEVAQQHFVISLLAPQFSAFYQPWFKGYDGRVYSVSGTVGAPSGASYYAARFWIDQSMKKSMGQ